MNGFSGITRRSKATPPEPVIQAQPRQLPTAADWPKEAKALLEELARAGEWLIRVDLTPCPLP
jgi:hypothetical protein